MAESRRRWRCAVIDAAALSGQADPIAANDPLAVALDLRTRSRRQRRLPTISIPRRKITFEELVVEDEIDVPDFMKSEIEIVVNKEHRILVCPRFISPLHPRIFCPSHR
jgi:hypothetical protein